MTRTGIRVDEVIRVNPWLTFAALDVINGRSNTRKNTHANATDNGVVISNEIVRMCNRVNPNQYQCISTNECVR